MTEISGKAEALEILLSAAKKGGREEMREDSWKLSGKKILEFFSLQ